MSEYVRAYTYRPQTPYFCHEIQKTPNTAQELWVQVEHLSPRIISSNLACAAVVAN